MARMFGLSIAVATGHSTAFLPRNGALARCARSQNQLILNDAGRLSIRHVCAGNDESVGAVFRSQQNQLTSANFSRRIWSEDIDHIRWVNLTPSTAHLYPQVQATGTDNIIGGPPMSVKLTIISEMQKVAKEHDQTLAPLTDDLVLIDSGLDSLAFAVLVVRLESELGVDPFTASEDLEFPVTLRDFVAAYENATKSVAA
jgi:acyl carrier protein